MLLRQPYTLMEEEEEDVLINEGESESGWTGIGAIGTGPSQKWERKIFFT
jgi:hypothetical protein